MPLVTGYNSDSGSDNGVAKSSSGLSSFLPPPKSATASASKQGKRQITIESLSSLGVSTEPAAKRVKVDALPSSAAPKLGLFGILPAPKALSKPKDKADTPTASEKVGGEASSMGVQLAPPTSQEPSIKVKGNDAFRAMLGLAPSSAESASRTSIPNVTAEPLAPPKPQSEDMGGFFGLAPASVPSSSSVPRFTPARTKFSISAAPTHEHDGDDDDEQESYPGWSQDPDGSWVPLTPAAHAQYAAWLEEQRLEAAKKKPERNAAAAELARAGVDVASLRTVDAGADAQAAYDAQPPPARSDARYAAAAAAVGSAASIEEAGGEDAKKMDKKSGFRAMQKGQLSALLAAAEENKERLEEKWARGKAAKRQAGQKYGF